jgi:hypothetical protein
MKITDNNKLALASSDLLNLNIPVTKGFACSEEKISTGVEMPLIESGRSKINTTDDHATQFNYFLGNSFN